MSLVSALRSVPEFVHFSPEQQEDLLRSFVPPAVRRRVLGSMTMTMIYVSLVPLVIGRYLFPPYVTLSMLGITLLIAIPLAWGRTKRQFCAEFSILLKYMLSGRVLPACPRCGYDLSWATESQCPECGADVKWKPVGGEGT